VLALWSLPPAVSPVSFFFVLYRKPIYIFLGTGGVRPRVASWVLRPFFSSQFFGWYMFPQLLRLFCSFFCLRVSPLFSRPALSLLVLRRSFFDVPGAEFYISPVYVWLSSLLPAPFLSFSLVSLCLVVKSVWFFLLCGPSVKPALSLVLGLLLLFSFLFFSFVFFVIVPLVL